MTRSRDAILSRIRSSLGAKANDAERIATAHRHIEAHPSSPVPARVAVDDAARFALFKSYLEGQQARVLAAEGVAGVPAVVATCLKSLELPLRMRLGFDPRLESLPWKESGITTEFGKAEASDAVGLSYALAGIAETGTLVVAAGRDNPVTLAFLPATHVILVDRATIVASYEDAIARVREALGPHTMPRTLNYISGPSRTADIGGKIVIGAHGPRALVVVVVG